MRGKTPYSGKTFTVLKQKDNRGPVYKVDVCTATLCVVNAELLKEVPSEWTLNDFYTMWDEGRRLNIDFAVQSN